LADLSRARRILIEAGALVGQSDHRVSLSLYAKDPDGLEFELFWTVPDGKPIGTRPLDLDAELARRRVSRLYAAPARHPGLGAAARLGLRRAARARTELGNHTRCLWVAASRRSRASRAP